MLNLILIVCLTEAIFLTLYLRNRKRILYIHILFFLCTLSFLTLFCASNVYLAKYNATGKLLNQYISIANTAWNSFFFSNWSLETLSRLINYSSQLFISTGFVFYYSFSTKKTASRWPIIGVLLYAAFSGLYFDPFIQRVLYINLYPSQIAYENWFALQRIISGVFFSINCVIMGLSTFFLVRHLLHLPKFAELRLSSLFMLLCQITLSVGYIIMFNWVPCSLLKYSKLTGISTFVSIDLSMDASLSELMFYFQIAAFLALTVSLFFQTRLTINLRNSMREIVQSKRMLRASSRILLHYIKNEIFAIQSEAEFARDTNLGNMNRALTNIEVRCMQVWDHLEDMYSSAKSRRLVMHRLELLPLVERALSSFSIGMENINTSINIPKNLRIYADRTSFCNMLDSIIRNAVEALCKSSNVPKVIEIYAIAHHAWVDLHIKDNGIGIQQREITRVFSPFYSSKNQHTNWGLGLSLCQDIVLAHGGRITLDSQPGCYTDVRIMLPFYEENISD